MTQINKLVEDFIEKNIVLKRAFEDDIISLRKVAKFIILELDLNVSNLDAVISACRRFKIDKNNLSYKNAKNIVKNSKISSRSDIVGVAIERDENVFSILPKLFNEINYNKGEVLRIIQAEESIKVVIDKRNLQKIVDIVSENKIIRIEENLAEINLLLDEVAVNTPGIISTIFTELMVNDVNIMETMSCVPEMILFVKEKDLLKCYSVLFDLIKG